MSRGWLGRLAVFVVSHRVGVTVVAALVSLVAAVVAFPPRVEANLVALLPRDIPAIAALAHISEAGGANGVLLVFEGAPDDVLDARMQQLAARLLREPTVAGVIGPLDPALRTHLALLQLDPAKVRAFGDRLQAAILMGPALNPLMAGALLGGLGEAKPDHELPGWRSGRLFVKPRASNLDPDFCTRLVAAIGDAIRAEGLAADGIRLRYMGGPHVLVADGVAQTRKDLSRTSIVSAVLVLLVLVVGMRSFRAPVLILIPIGVAAVFNLALTAIVLGAINSYTVIGTAVLFGLGIDFAIQLLARYREERAHHLGLEEALAAAWDGTGPPAIAAGLSSALAFVSLALSRFRGLSELGVSLAMGLVSSLVTVFVLLPVLIPWLGESRASEPVPRAVREAEGGRRTPRFLLVALVAATVLLARVARDRLAFEYDFTALGRPDMAISHMTASDRELATQAFPPIVVDLPQDATLPEEHERFRALIDRGVLPHVTGVLSMESFLPHDQESRVAALARVRDLVLRPEAHWLPPAVVQALGVVVRWEPRVRTEADLPGGLVDLLAHGRRVLLLPRSDLNDLRESSALAAELAPYAPDATSEQVAQGILFRILSEDAPKVFTAAFLWVVLVSVVHLRHPVRTVVSMAGLVVGLVWAAAAVAVAGISLNLANIVGLPILVGIADDVAIYLSHRLHTEGSLGAALRTVALASVLCTLTAAVSFAALEGAQGMGIRSLGSLVALGLLVITPIEILFVSLAWRAGIGR